MPEIMHEQDDVRIVKISQRFESSNTTVDMFISTFTCDEIELLHTDLHYASGTFRLSPAQMDDLFAAWVAYKEDQQGKEIAERDRLVRIEAKAYRLAAPYPEIKIDTHDDTDSGHAWEVSIPRIGWTFEHWQYSPEDFLEAVKVAIGVYEKQLTQ
jgi:hypothetical protein